MSHLKMTTRLVMVTVLCLCWQSFASAADEKKADPSGTWKWERTRGDRTFTSTLKLNLVKDKLTGTYKGSRRDAVKIENAKIDGDKISFGYSGEFNGQKFTLKYQGKVSEDSIVGSGEFTRGDQSREFDWTAKRSVEIADILGTWSFESKRDNGETSKSSIIITNEDDKLKGEYTSRFGTRDANEISLKKGELSFVLEGENDGRKWKVVYKFKPRGTKAKGTLSFNFNDNERLVEFTGTLEPPKKKEKVKEKVQD